MPRTVAPLARGLILAFSAAFLASCSEPGSEDAPVIVSADEASAMTSHAAAETDDVTSVSSTNTAPPAASSSASDSSAGRPPSDLIARGETAFNEGFCIKCHKAGGTGSGRAPNLTDDTWIQCDGSIDGIAAVIRSGVPKEKLSSPDYPFAMNSAAKMKLSDEEVEALAAYVWSLSR